MAWAWKQSIEPTDKFVLLALADHANDEEYTCWPSLNHLQKKTGFTRPTIWKAVDRLIQVGAVTRVGQSNLGSTVYRVMVGNELTLGKDVTQVTKLTRVGNDVNRVGNQGNKVGNDVNPNHQEPSGIIKEPSGNGKVSGKPNGLTGQALEVLEFLNAKTGRRFRGLDVNNRPTANLEFIIARLKTGVTVQDCKTVVARKFRDWGNDDKMQSFLRPETLFARKKFESYLGECTTQERRPE